ncbi:MAG: cytochrome c, partial [Luminiphilus sp.]|nr:cytochrome c [Luminiphilus sp.]
MIFNRAIVAVAFLVAANSALADGVMKGDAAAGEALVASCTACHGADGNSLAPTFPKLAGLGERYLLKQMKDIRDGRRPVALMAGQVDNMTDQQLADIAAFYDGQTRTSGTT